MAKQPVVDREPTEWYQCLVETYNDNLADLKLRHPDIFKEETKNPLIKPPPPIREPNIKLGPEWDGLSKKDRDALIAVIAKNGTYRDFLEMTGGNCPCKNGDLPKGKLQHRILGIEKVSSGRLAVSTLTLCCPCIQPDRPVSVMSEMPKPRQPLSAFELLWSRMWLNSLGTDPNVFKFTERPNASEKTYSRTAATHSNDSNNSAPHQLSEMMTDCINLSIHKAQRSMLIKRLGKKTLPQALKQMYFCSKCKCTSVNGSSFWFVGHKCKDAKEMSMRTIHEKIRHISVHQAVDEFLKFDLFPSKLSSSKAKLRALKDEDVKTKPSTSEA